MIDHAQRIAEEKHIDEMERRAWPIAFVLVLALVAILIDFGLNVYADDKYQGTKETADIFAQCLSGTFIDTGDGIIKCSVSKPKLIGGIK
jgi:hypothetical protein